MTRFINGFGATNKLLKCVQADLAEPLYMAGCRALGLVSKIITAPLWRCLEDKEIHILDLPQVYRKIEDALKRGAEHPQEFMEGLTQPLQDVEDDAIFKALILPCENDGLTATVLENILPALCKVMAAHSAHVAEVGEDERESSKSVAKHNKFPERVFAYLDQQMRTRPNTSLLVHEATIMFSLNKTGDWLKALSPQEADDIICSARKRARTLRSLFKERSEAIKQEKMKALEERERERERKEEKRRLDLEHFTQEINYYGLWQSEREVDEMLNTLSTPKQKMDALKAQLRFRQHVLRQIPPRPEVFLFSSKGVAHSWDVLSTNVKTLVHQAFTLPSASAPEGGLPLLVGKRVRRPKHKLF
ncbi:uncharacterized protein LOC121405570 [Lytechinus variegatus]|uniref:uncharacterized protein LOC121405570 n=1 Tax=Lytechinus variegatus TaxID=7654 RepID=UPI001BB1702D|nr:uncharacterized protein LOC121405570 [Lytechinus variegatus]